MPNQEIIPTKIPLSLPKETYIAALTALAIAIYLVLRYLAHLTIPLSFVPLYVALAIGGIPIVMTLGKKLWAREFGSDLLAGISILSSVLLGQYLVGAIIVLMLSGGSALEQFATRRASSVLDALAKRMPRVAHRKHGAEIEDINLDQVNIGETLLILPHELCPVDGVVTDGRGVMDESYLTGEPFQISKTPGSTVLSGAINGDVALTIEAQALAVDSRYAKIMQVMEQSQEKRPKLRRIGDRIGAWYTPRSRTRGSIMGRLRRPYALFGRRRDRYPLSSHFGDPGSSHRSDLAGCKTQHHHQKSSRLGADHYLPYADFR